MKFVLITMLLLSSLTAHATLITYKITGVIDRLDIAPPNWDLIEKVAYNFSFTLDTTTHEVTNARMVSPDFNLQQVNSAYLDWNDGFLEPLDLWLGYLKLHLV